MKFVSKTIKCLDFNHVVGGIPGPIGQILQTKVNDVLSKNDRLKDMSSILNGKVVQSLKYGSGSGVKV